MKENFRKSIVLFIGYFLLIVIVFIFQNENIFVKAATFVDSFATLSFIDEASNTADWDTDNTTGHLINGDWRQMDESTLPYVYKEEAVSGLTAPTPLIIHDADGQPLMVLNEANAGQVIKATKWTVDAGESVCGAGITDCWTDLTGTVSGLGNSAHTLTGSSTYVRKKIGRMPNGYPVVVFLEFDTVNYNLYYMQWEPDASNGVCASGNACWTNAAGTVEGAEKISNNNPKAANAYKTFDFIMDQYGQANIMWNEFDATNLTYHYTRWNGSNWTYADRSTVGKQQLTTKVTSDSADLEFMNGNGNIYILLRYDDYNYVGKWNGSNWVDLADSTFSNYTSMTIFKAANDSSVGIGQDRKRNYLMFTDNRFYAGVSSFTIGTADNYLAYWDDVADTWKYVDGTTIGNNQTAIDNMTELFDGETWDLHELFMVSLSVSGKTGNILLLMSNYDGADSELHFSQWDGSQWLQTDGETVGYEVATNLVYGASYNNYSAVTIDNYGQPIFSYVDRAYTSPNKSLPFYFSRFNGRDITGVNGYTSDRDMIGDDGQVLATGLFSQDIYYNNLTGEIFLVGSTGDSGLLVTKYFPNKYPDQDQDLISTTIATPHNSATAITSATLTSVDSKPVGTAITYSLSADGGSNWCTVTIGVLVSFTTCGPGSSDVSGDDLRWKANLTSGGEDSTPTIEYLYVDVEGKTEGTSGDIIITANIEPELTLVLSSSTCDLGVFYTDKLTTCSYSATVATNATSGYTAYIRENGELTHANATDTITEVGGADNEITAAETTKEEYGVSTSLSGQTIAENDTGVTCANLDDQGTSSGNTSMPATALSTSDQTFASALAPASEETTLCHATSITGLTEAGTYSHTVTITVVGNF